MKVLHAPLNLANDPWSLVGGLRELGVDAHLATIASSPYTHVGDIDLSFPEVSTITRQIAKWNFCRTELPKYDVVHYHTGHSILDYGDGRAMLLDMKAAHKRGQVIAVTFHGCEVRALQEGGCPWPCPEPVCKTGAKRERLALCMEMADLLYVTTPDLLPAVPGATLLPQSVEGIELAPVTPPQLDGPLRIAHLPSRRSTKGTDSIIATIRQLQAEGLQLDFRLIENMPHAQALEAMKDADIIIDHVQIGWYCVVSVEAAAMGKPVIVNIEDEFVELSGLEAPPFTRANKQTLGSVIKDLGANRETLAALGQRNREFVLGRHSAQANAQRLLEDYQRVLGERPPTSTQLSDVVIPHKVSCE